MKSTNKLRDTQTGVITIHHLQTRIKIHHLDVHQCGNSN